MICCSMPNYFLALAVSSATLCEALLVSDILKSRKSDIFYLDIFNNDGFSPSTERYLQPHLADCEHTFEL